MFTGIVLGMATVEDLSGTSELKTLTLRTHLLPDDIVIGDSIAISGCCLTVITRKDDQFTFEVMGETLEKTTLGALRPGDQVNIEPAMRANTQMGGHMVSGHIDGIGEVVDIRDNDGWHTLYVRVPDEIRRLVSPKGCICIEGTSLTIIDVDDRADGTVISIGIIPHTSNVTTLGTVGVGDAVNMEADLLARYVWRLIETSQRA